MNEGLMKMYEAEVLGKRVVVQHLPLGGLVRWDPPPSPAGDVRTPMQMQGVEYQHSPAGIADSDATMTTTGAPWATNTTTAATSPTSNNASPDPERWSLSPSMMTVPLGPSPGGGRTGFGGIAFEQEQFWIPGYTSVAAPAVSALGRRAGMMAESRVGPGLSRNGNASTTTTAAPWARTNAGAGAGAAPPPRRDERGNGDDARWGVPMRR